MYVEKIEVKNFRNYDAMTLALDQGTNIFYGNNAQGKTNILEAVYLCGTTKSHRGSRDKDMIRFGEDESHIRMIVRKQDVPYRIDMHLKKNRAKGIAVNEVPIKKASELFGIVNFVCFSPEDLNMVKNGPAERRRFLNVELCQINRLYMDDLTKYNKILEQRNRTLKELQYRRDYQDMLDIWDEQLLFFGSRIIEEREKFLGYLNEIVRDIHGSLTNKNEHIELIYEPDTTKNDFSIKLREARDRDTHMKSTTVGPHRDDFAIRVDIRRFGSQGQQRTSALSIKLSEIEILKQKTKDTPILLLDDVLSELDSNRQNYLLKSISHIQTLITCTGLDDFIENRFPINQVYEVISGHVKERKQHEQRIWCRSDPDSGRFGGSEKASRYVYRQHIIERSPSSGL